MPSTRRSRLAAATAAAALAFTAGCGGSDTDEPTPDDQAAAPTVRFDAGTLRGSAGDGVRTFQGIPFAKPPVGDLRLRAPQPAPGWEGTLDATAPGPVCAQPASPPLQKEASAEEDCLYLNVTVPADAGDEPLPVMVWLHGGGGTMGSGSLYDARRLAEQGDVVVVTPNYRLGALGLLAVPGLPDGGTFALADQIAALEWSRDNIAAFGGDPGNTTVFGESQGGFSVCGLLTSPAADGLYQRAAMQSGNCSIRFPRNGFVPGIPATSTFMPRAAAEATGAEVLEDAGCSGPDAVACLREAPVERLLETPVVAYAYGTRLLPQAPEAALEAGDAPDVPVIVGTTADEARGVHGGGLRGASKATVTRANYPRLLREAFGAQAARRVERAYPLGGGELPGETFADVMTDAAWACPTTVTRDLLAARQPTYAYEFDDPQSPNINFVDFPGFDPGTGHAHDLPYLFDLGGQYALEAQGSQALAEEMIGFYANFARTGEPGGDWPRFSGEGDTFRLSPDRPGTFAFAQAHRCDLWASLSR